MHTCTRQYVSLYLYSLTSLMGYKNDMHVMNFIKLSSGIETDTGWNVKNLTAYIFINPLGTC